MHWIFEIVSNIVREHLHYPQLNEIERQKVDHFLNEYQPLFQRLITPFLALEKKFDSHSNDLPLEFFFYFIDSFKKRISKEKIIMDANNFSLDLQTIHIISFSSLISALKQHSEYAIYIIEIVNKFIEFREEKNLSNNDIEISEKLKAFKACHSDHLEILQFDMEPTADEILNYLKKYASLETIEKIYIELKTGSYKDKEFFIHDLKNLYFEKLKNNVFRTNSPIAYISSIKNLISSADNVYRLCLLVDLLNVKELECLKSTTIEGTSFYFGLIESIQAKAFDIFTNQWDLNSFDIQKREIILMLSSIFKLTEPNSTVFKKLFYEENHKRTSHAATQTFRSIYEQINETFDLTILEQILLNLKKNFEFLKTFPSAEKNWWDPLVSKLQAKAYFIMHFTLLPSPNCISLTNIITFQKIYQANPNAVHLKQLIDDNVDIFRRIAATALFNQMYNATQIEQMDWIMAKLHKPELYFLNQSAKELLIIEAQQKVMAIANQNKHISSDNSRYLQFFEHPPATGQKQLLDFYNKLKASEERNNQKRQETFEKRKEETIKETIKRIEAKKRKQEQDQHNQELKNESTSLPSVAESSLFKKTMKIELMKCIKIPNIPPAKKQKISSSPSKN